MKRNTGIMCQTSKEKYIRNRRECYLKRNRAGKSQMIAEVADTLDWDRKHTIKVLNGKCWNKKPAKERKSRVTYGEVESRVIIEIWKLSEQPCGKRLKETLPLWLESYSRHYGDIGKEVCDRVLGYSARTLDRITRRVRATGEGGRKGRKTGRSSNRLKQFIPIRCGPQEFQEPGWMEADTVAHGGDSTRGLFLWSLTMTDFYSGWTELAALWGASGGEVCVGLKRIEKRMPFSLVGFDTDNGSEFLNEVLEKYFRSRKHHVCWTRSRPYKKNDQAHVEQKNFTHVRQLLGYGRFDELELKELVNDLYEKAWLPLRNYFTPVMKLVGKKRMEGKVKKTYDMAATPCDRLLACEKVSEETRENLRLARAGYDPVSLTKEIEKRLSEIFTVVEKIEEERREMRALAEKEYEGYSGDRGGSVSALVACAPKAFTTPPRSENLAKTTQKSLKKHQA